LAFYVNGNKNVKSCVKISSGYREYGKQLQGILLLPHPVYKQKFAFMALSI